VSYTYATFQQALALYMAIPNMNVETPNFVAALPSIIDYAEQRCYRELDLLAARGEWFGHLIPGVVAFPMAGSIAYPLTKNLPIPITVERVRILQPVGVATPPAHGSVTAAIPCSPVAPEWLDAVYGPGADQGVPVWFSHTTQDLLEFGPPPDQAYTISIFGMYRPFPLYSAPPNDGTQTTFLTTYVPDLFLAAAMVNASGYQKNFGAQMDDPKMAMSWETQYQTLFKSAMDEELRKRFHGWQANTAENPVPPAPPAAMPIPGG
jgi:hypothetical protein